MNVADTERNGRGPRRQGRPDPGCPWEREPVGALPLTVGSLFAGIGGFDLGLERAGMRTLWFCEQDPFCRRVLARHWPGVPCYPDVRQIVADTARDGSEEQAPSGTLGERARPGSERGGATGGHPDVRALVADTAHRESQQPEGDHDGGPLGGAGTRAGGGGSSGGAPSRSRNGRRDQVAADASDAGSALPVPVPYVDILCGGFPCQDISLAGRGAGLAGERSGLWREFARLIGELRPRYVLVENVPALTHRGLDVVLADLAACGFDAEWDHLPASAFGAPHRRDRIWLVAYPNADGGRLEEPGERNGRTHGPELEAPQRDDADRLRAAMGDPDAERRNGRTGELGPGRRGEPADPGWWLIEPDVGRVAHGVPARVDRLRSLGNALVPQIAEWLGRQILEWERVSI